MMNLTDTFLKHLPSDFKLVIDHLNKHNWAIRFVGGVIRDLVVMGKPGEDWDAEIMPMDMACDFDKVKNELKSFGEISEGAYRVLTLKFETGIELEMAPARLEHFKNELGHKNFEAEWATQLGVDKTFIRRDFTMNAMSVSFYPGKTPIFEDPFKGAESLSLKQLSACSVDFVRDPVRALRAFRFASDYKLSFDQNLIIQLQLMDLSHVGLHYWKSEFKKSSDWRVMARGLLDFYPGPSEWRDVLVETIVNDSLFKKYEVDLCFSIARSTQFKKLAHWWQISMKRVERWNELFSLLKSSNEWISNLEDDLKLDNFNQISGYSSFKSAQRFFKLWQELSGEMEDEGILLIDLALKFDLDQKTIISWRKYLRLSFIMVNPDVAEKWQHNLRSTYIFYHRLKLSYAR